MGNFEAYVEELLDFFYNELMTHVGSSICGFTLGYFLNGRGW